MQLVRRRDFLAAAAASPFALRLWPVYLPTIARATLPKAKGWGMGISYQMHLDGYCGLAHTLATFDPVWWHDWAYLSEGATPTMYDSATYTTDPAAADRRAHGWPQVLWSNEPELPYGEEPKAVADAVRMFKERNPGVKVYGFGSVNESFRGWLREYKLAGGDEVDGYHFHVYMHSADEWHGRFLEMLRIAQRKPIIISECGGWGVNTPEAEQLRIMDVMREAATDGQIEAVAWFCARPKYDQAEWYGNALLDEQGGLTALGRHWLTLR